MNIFFKNSLLICFFTLITCNVNALDTLYFVGNMKISKKTSYKYNLRFVISSDNKVIGYSLSDPGGVSETKTKIFGTFDSTKMVLTFEEKDVLRSKVDTKKSDLCFVKAKLKLKKTKILEQLSGSFSAYEMGGKEACASGQIKLINTNTAKVILKKMNSIDEEKEPEDVDVSQYKEKVTKISDNKGAEFLVTGKKVKISLWDNGQVDGDKINILLNDKIILENYIVTTKVKVIEITLLDIEKNAIKVVAINEGTLPPNTAAIKIETATEAYPIITQAKEKEVRTIYLKNK
jgi:hypothetical protein